MEFRPSRRSFLVASAATIGADGTQFRAAFSNLAGGASSDPATLHQ